MHERVASPAAHDARRGPRAGVTSTIVAFAGREPAAWMLLEALGMLELRGHDAATPFEVPAEDPGHVAPRHGRDPGRGLRVVPDGWARAAREPDDGGLDGEPTGAGGMPHRLADGETGIPALGRATPGALQAARGGAARRADELGERDGALPRASAMPLRTAVGCIHSATRASARTPTPHPRGDCTDRVVVVLDGAVADAAVLRRGAELDGHRVGSDLDAELVAHLVEDALRVDGSLMLAIERVRPALGGRWALVALDAVTGDLAGTSHERSLVVARSDDGVLLASDVRAVAESATSHQELVADAIVAVVAGRLHWRRAGAMVVEPEPVRVG